MQHLPCVSVENQRLYGLQQKPRRRVQNRAYNDFCAENGLKRQQERLHIAGWNKSQASAASAAARKKSKQSGGKIERGSL